MFFVHRFIPVSLFDNTAISMAASGSEAFCNGCPHVWEADGWFAFIKTCVFLMDTWLANRWSLGPIWDSHPPPNRCFIEKAAPLSLSACTLPYTLSLFTLHRSSFNCFFRCHAALRRTEIRLDAASLWCLWMSRRRGSQSYNFVQHSDSVTRFRSRCSLCGVKSSWVRGLFSSSEIPSWDALWRPQLESRRRHFLPRLTQTLPRSAHSSRFIFALGLDPEGGFAETTCYLLTNTLKDRGPVTNRIAWFALQWSGPGCSRSRVWQFADVEGILWVVPGGLVSESMLLTVVA